jgi:hypothetical protein
VDVINFKKFFLYSEAIRLKHAKKHKLSRKKSGAYRGKLNDIFNGKDRLIFDIDIKRSQLLDVDYPIVHEINKFLYRNYQDVHIKTMRDYIFGVVYKNSDVENKQPMKIGRLLQKKIDSDKDAAGLLNSFKIDPMRSTKPADYKVVVSRHPYDIAGASTDRNWTSCMRLNTGGVNYPNSDSSAGSNSHYVKKDISHGSIVAYLVTSDDKHPNGKIAIKRPLSRILMKPHDEMSGNSVAYSIGKTYGAPCEEFRSFIKDWLTNDVNADVKGKKMHLRSGLYSDGDEPVNFEKSDYSESVASEIFYDLLGNQTEDKDLGFFEVEAGQGYYEGYYLKIKITFDIPESIEIESEIYDRGDRIPNALKNIVGKILTGGRQYTGIRECDGIEISKENHQFIVTYNISYNGEIGYEDEKGNQQDPTEDEVYDFWLDAIRNIGIGNFNYRETLKEVIKMLKTYSTDYETERQNDLKNCEESIQHHLNSDRFVTAMDKYEEICKESLPIYQRLGKIDLNNIQKFYQSILSPEFPNDLQKALVWQRERRNLFSVWEQVMRMRSFGTIDSAPLVKDALRKEFGKYDAKILDIHEKIRKNCPHTIMIRILRSVREDPELTKEVQDLLFKRMQDFWELT